MEEQDSDAGIGLLFSLVCRSRGDSVAVSFELGILPNRPAGDCARMARQAEERGYGGVWIAESRSPMHDAHCVLAVLTAQTNALQLASGPRTP